MGGVDPAYVVPRCKDSGRRKDDTYLLHYADSRNVVQHAVVFCLPSSGKAQVSHIRFRCLISRMVPNITITYTGAYIFHNIKYNSARKGCNRLEFQKVKQEVSMTPVAGSRWRFAQSKTETESYP